MTRRIEYKFEELDVSGATVSGTAEIGFDAANWSVEKLIDIIAFDAEGDVAESRAIQPSLVEAALRASRFHSDSIADAIREDDDDLRIWGGWQRGEAA